MFIQKLHKLQAQWAKEVVIPQESRLTYFLSRPMLVLDIQYEGEKAYLGASLLSPNQAPIDLIGQSQAGLAYIPGLFCFREGPPLLAFVKKIFQHKALPRPALLIIDGHGIAHPQKLGVATWLGLRLQIPTIGCAKRSLLPYHGELGEERGSTLPVMLQGEQVGEVLRTQEGINPLFVSAGHLIHLEDAHQIMLYLPGAYRLPDALRQADQLARAAARKERLERVISLGECEAEF